MGSNRGSQLSPMKEAAATHWHHSRNIGGTSQHGQFCLVKFVVVGLAAVVTASTSSPMWEKK
eukprot:3522799-Amphidinium_carterae.1